MGRSAGHGRPRERRDPGATRAALLGAGAALFAERGFDGVPIEDLAERAGGYKALISYHFGGKRGLYSAVLASAFAEMAARLRTVMAEPGDARRSLHRILETFASLREERPDFPVLFIREVLSTGIDPAVAPHLVEIVGVTRRLAERGVKQGVFRKQDPMLMHMALVGSIAFFFATEPARRRFAAERRLPFSMPDSRAFLRYLEDLTVRGLAPDRPAPGRKGARA
jgi:AcrR family transcriptional regulator